MRCHGTLLTDCEPVQLALQAMPLGPTSLTFPGAGPVSQFQRAWVAPSFVQGRRGWLPLGPHWRQPYV